MEAIRLRLEDSLYEEAMQTIHSLLSLPYHQSFDPFLSFLAFALHCLLGTSHSPVLHSSGKLIAGLGDVFPQLQ